MEKRHYIILALDAAAPRSTTPSWTCSWLGNQDPWDVSPPRPPPPAALAKKGLDDFRPKFDHLGPDSDVPFQNALGPADQYEANQLAIVPRILDTHLTPPSPGACVLGADGSLRRPKLVGPPQPGNTKRAMRAAWLAALQPRMTQPRSARTVWQTLPQTDQTVRHEGGAPQEKDQACQRQLGSGLGPILYPSSVLHSLLESLCGHASTLDEDAPGLLFSPTLLSGLLHPCLYRHSLPEAEYQAQILRASLVIQAHQHVRRVP